MWLMKSLIHNEQEDRLKKESSRQAATQIRTHYFCCARSSQFLRKLHENKQYCQCHYQYHINTSPSTDQKDDEEENDEEIRFMAGCQSRENKFLLYENICMTLK